MFFGFVSYNKDRKEYIFNMQCELEKKLERGDSCHRKLKVIRPTA